MASIILDIGNADERRCNGCPWLQRNDGRWAHCEVFDEPKTTHPHGYFAREPECVAASSPVAAPSTPEASQPDTRLRHPGSEVA